MSQSSYKSSLLSKNKENIIVIEDDITISSNVSSQYKKFLKGEDESNRNLLSINANSPFVEGKTHSSIKYDQKLKAIKLSHSPAMSLEDIGK